MADKVSFTSFGSKKKVSKVRRKSKSKPKTDFDADALLDEVLAAKKLAEDSISSAQSSAIASLPSLWNKPSLPKISIAVLAIFWLNWVLNNLNIKTAFIKNKYTDQFDEQAILSSHGKLF